MAKKQLIKLTETDLHNIIKESVKNILSELDWRTLDAAHDEAVNRMRTAMTPEEENLAFNQAQKFKRGMVNRQTTQYDGINDTNYYRAPSTFPDTEVKTQGARRFEKLNGQAVNGEIRPLSRDKQLRGAAQIARHKRGGDEFNRDTMKWMPKK